MSVHCPDLFLEPAAWQAIASGDARLELGPVADGAGLRMAFDFHGGGGFVVARREVALDLPEAFSFHFVMRGRMPVNALEFKLVDASGLNVWRYRIEHFTPAVGWTELRIAARDLVFAWGPLGGGAPCDIAAVEVVIAAGAGGAGFLDLSELTLRDDTYRATPRVFASHADSRHPAAAVFDEDPDPFWRGDAGGQAAWLEVDFIQIREFGGLVIDWLDTAPAVFHVRFRLAGAEWSVAWSTTQGGGRRSFIALPDARADSVRLDFPLGGVVGIRRLVVQPQAFSASPNAFVEHVARLSPLGFYPTTWLGKFSAWTPVGTGAGSVQALINEQGLIETGKGAFSLEPYVVLDGRLMTWADVAISQGLDGGDLPLPWVRWQGEGWTLTVTLCVENEVLFIRYTMAGLEGQLGAARLVVAIRPLQVTPAWQHWRRYGGVAPIHSIAVDAGGAWVEGRRLAALTPVDAAGAAAFSAGVPGDFLARGVLPQGDSVDDPEGLATALLAFDRPCAAHWVPVDLAIALGSVPLPKGLDAGAAFERTRSAWRVRLGHVGFVLPAGRQALAEVFRTAAAHILIHRDGPALHPGPRRYDRAWLRDGVLMGAALARAGLPCALRDFVLWYARQQRTDGNLPDCVDPQETEWLPEYDAFGQLLFGAAEFLRFREDADFLTEIRPALWKSLAFMEKLRQSRLTAHWREPDRRACYGLLPESMSHEGYMAHPVHAYWDDFWALRGFKDAMFLAGKSGDAEEARRLEDLGRCFRADLLASIDATMARHDIDFLPGSVELGDFDPAASAIALTVAGEAGHLPRSAVERLFARYLENFRRRACGAECWSNYSAYEVRVVGSLVRLGWRDAALEVLDFLLADRRIPAWNQWPEISWRDAKGPSFLGDLPHSWIGAEYILAVCSLFAFEDEDREALILAAGVGSDWLSGGGVVGVTALPTHHGEIDYTLRLERPGRLHVQVGGAVRVPRGGLVFRPPLPAAGARLVADSGAVTATKDEVVFHAVPGEAWLEF